jgi:ribosome biogenesis GTPase A
MREADILLEIIDARAISDTRNIEIEDKVRSKGKPLIFVLNKCDLVADRDSLDAAKKMLHPCAFVSAKEYHGMNMLRERIMIEAKRIGVQVPKVGVLGYPNMGKSSIINALNGGASASVSSESGHTKGKQYIRARNINLIDTPGVIPYKEGHDVKNSITGIKTDSKDPEGDLLLVMEKLPGIIEGYYGVEVDEDKEASLESIGRKLNLLKKGGTPDTTRTAKRILLDLRIGKIKI